MVWRYTLGATKFVASAGASHRCKKVRQTMAPLSGSFALPEGGGNGGSERTNPFWLWVDFELKALSLFWLGHFGRGSSNLTTWQGMPCFGQLSVVFKGIRRAALAGCRRSIGCPAPRSCCTTITTQPIEVIVPGSVVIVAIRETTKYTKHTKVVACVHSSLITAGHLSAGTQDRSGDPPDEEGITNIEPFPSVCAPRSCQPPPVPSAKHPPFTRAASARTSSKLNLAKCSRGNQTHVTCQRSPGRLTNRSSEPL